MPVSDHLPAKLSVCLWDFTWYTRTGPGEPFDDLDAAFTQAVQRGYNTIRICAMPYLLFGSGLDTSALTFAPLGGGFGLRTRWYDVRRSTVLDGRAHLVALFEAARRHDCYVIVSSWEYQQSPCFVTDPAWIDSLLAVPPGERPAALADSLAELVTFLQQRGLDDRIAYVEIHNEVQYSRLTDAVEAGNDPVSGLQPLLEGAIDNFRSRHRQVPVTANYASVPIGGMRGLIRNADVAAFHLYAYGVLGQLVDEFALRDPSRPFPQERAFAELLRPEAPPVDEWHLPAESAWRAEATIMHRREVYVHDWCNPSAWDRWLYERYADHRRAMRAKLELWIDTVADWAMTGQSLPLVLGEGWIGYTPLHGTFEEGPVGAEICEHMVDRAATLSAWGTVVCSNAAPHHPMWADVALQRRLNGNFVR